MPGSSPEDPLRFADVRVWRHWLKRNHDSADQAWVVHYKKRSRLPGLRYEEAVEEALCFGWIDSKMKSLDADRTVQRYSPRRSRSIWSPSNRARAERLLAEGRMAPPGLAVIERAKDDGSWERACNDALQRFRVARPTR